LKTPERQSLLQVMNEINRFKRGCVANGDSLECGTCGTPISEKLAYLSIHSIDIFPDMCAGAGKVLNAMIPYCPKCEPEPEERGCIHMPMLESLMRHARAIFN
jgi:hypothetical protein